VDHKSSACGLSLYRGAMPAWMDGVVLQYTRAKGGPVDQPVSGRQQIERRRVSRRGKNGHGAQFIEQHIAVGSKRNRVSLLAIQRCISYC
jgi:hypothetical protein